MTTVQVDAFSLACLLDYLTYLQDSGDLPHSLRHAVSSLDLSFTAQIERGRLNKQHNQQKRGA